MPMISQFYGIKISIFFIQKEHNPLHLHAQYGEFDAEIDIETGNQIRENLPSRADALVKNGFSLHSEELKNMWKTQQFRQLPLLE